MCFSNFQLTKDFAEEKETHKRELAEEKEKHKSELAKETQKHRDDLAQQKSYANGFEDCLKDLNHFLTTNRTPQTELQQPTGDAAIAEQVKYT